MKKEIRNLNTSKAHQRFLSIYKTMLSYCLKCRRKDSKSQKVANAIKEKLISLTKLAVCGSRKSKFIKEREASGLLSSFEIKISLSQIPFAGSILL